ncbi:DUF805 domain-containing protein [Flavobacterium pedocola]
MIEYYKKAVFENYANFNGRARRSEYWYFLLMNMIIGAVVVLPVLYFSDEIGPWFLAFLGLYAMAMVIPTLAVICRRLHDIGKSGWYYCVRFIPIIGPIWFFIMMCTEGNRGANQYGRDPKQPFDEIDEIGTIIY